MADVVLGWDDFDKALDELEKDLEGIVRGLSVQVWNGVLSKTPQYDGRMAASWTYSIGSPVFEDRSHLVERPGPRNTQIRPEWSPEDAYYAGHPRAIGVSNDLNRGAERTFKLGQEIFISNGVDHGEGGYSGLIEDNAILLRSVNMPGRPVSRTLDFINARYAAGITAAQASKLKHMTIGTTNANDDS